MSYDALRWAMGQAVAPAMTKFLLVAMADCVNAEAGEMTCWPSYAYLARRTGMNTKTVEASVYRLRELGFLVDTGRRAGDTGKVVVYRLNDPKSGCVKPGPQVQNANGTRPHNDPETGVIGALGNPPKTDANPPNSGGQSPQKVEETTPKQGVRTSKGTRNRTRNEPGMESAAAPSIDGVSGSLVADWMKVRKDKRAGPLTETVIAGLTREAQKAGVSAEDAVRYCCEAGWQNFNAGFYAKREGVVPAKAPQSRPTGKHAGLSDIKYAEGVNADGTFA